MQCTTSGLGGVATFDVVFLLGGRDPQDWNGYFAHLWVPQDAMGQLATCDFVCALAVGDPRDGSGSVDGRGFGRKLAPV